MTHWGWYWKVKKKHIPKGLCLWDYWNAIDSFDIFNRNLQGLGWVRKSENRLLFEIFSPYKLKASLMGNDSLKMEHELGSYIIPVEQKACNYGGHYYFFHCPKCDRRMRKLYSIRGFYLCRKCAKLGYYTQILRPSERYLHMRIKVEDYLKARGGSLEEKPPRMRQSTFNRLRKKYVGYDEKKFNAELKEEIDWYGPPKGFIDDYYGWFVPSELYDVYDDKV